jgi:hypothetical protein
MWSGFCRPWRAALIYLKPLARRLRTRDTDSAMFGAAAAKSNSIVKWRARSLGRTIEIIEVCYRNKAHTRRNRRNSAALECAGLPYTEEPRRHFSDLLRPGSKSRRTFSLSAIQLPLKRTRMRRRNRSTYKSLFGSGSGTRNRPIAPVESGPCCQDSAIALLPEIR